MEKGIWETVDSTEWGEIMWSQIRRIGQATPEKEQSAAHISPARGDRLVVPPRGSDGTAHRHQGWCSDTYNHTAKHFIWSTKQFCCLNCLFAECFQRLKTSPLIIPDVSSHFNGQTYFIRWARHFISNQSFTTLPLNRDIIYIFYFKKKLKNMKKFYH